MVKDVVATLVFDDLTWWERLWGRNPRNDSIWMVKRGHNPPLTKTQEIVRSLDFEDSKSAIEILKDVPSDCDGRVEPYILPPIFGGCAEYVSVPYRLRPHIKQIFDNYFTRKIPVTK